MRAAPAAGRGFPVLELRGGPAERGRAYGNAAARQIRAARDFYLSTWSLPPGDLVARVRSFLPSLERFDPDLVDELRGIAEGSGCSFEEILAINARNEIMFGGPQAREGCTVMAARPPATEDGYVYLAQNWDWRPDLGGTGVVLRILAPGNPAMLTFVDAGRLAMHGLNEAGLGVCGNYLETSTHAGRPGIPIPFLRRRLLQCERVAPAVRLLEAAPRATSSNYLVADESGDIVDCEATPERVYRGAAEDGLLVHTNHFRYAAPPIEDAGLIRAPDSARRAERAEALLRRCSGQVGAAVLKRVLSDHDGYPASICRHGDDGPRWQTLASHVMDLTSRTLYLTAGTPCDGDYQTIRL
jgi:isopenicillin-N N-acyltransferase-like protein